MGVPNTRVIELGSRPYGYARSGRRLLLLPAGIVFEDLVADEVAPDETDRSSDRRSKSGITRRGSEQGATCRAAAPADQSPLLAHSEARTARSGHDEPEHEEDQLLYWA